MMQVRMQIEANWKFQHLGSVLKGHTDKWWTKFLSNMRSPTWNAFKDKVLIIVEDVMGENVHQDQLITWKEPRSPKIHQSANVIIEWRDQWCTTLFTERWIENEGITKVVTKNILLYSPRLHYERRQYSQDYQRHQKATKANQKGPLHVKEA